MRIRVKDVLEMLASGASEDKILADYPDLKREDIRACLEYAAQLPPHDRNQRPSSSLAANR